MSSNLLSNRWAVEGAEVDIYCQQITTCDICVRVLRKQGEQLWKGFDVFEVFIQIIPYI